MFQLAQDSDFNVDVFKNIELLTWQVYTIVIYFLILKYLIDHIKKRVGKVK